MTTDTDLDPNSDEPILAAMNAAQDGGSEAEALDVAISRMLAEEADAGRGVEPELHAVRQAEKAERDAAEAAARDDAAPKPPEPAKEDESDSQRRRRLRREAADRTRAERDYFHKEAARLARENEDLRNRAPDPAQYGEDGASYIADRAAHASDARAMEREAAKARQAAEALDARVAHEKEAAVAEYFSEGARRHADFEAVLKNDNLDITAAMAECLMDDGMHDIAYHLAKNPLEMTRIAALPTGMDQIKAILKAQAALEAKAAEATTSKAPPPLKTVKGGGAQSATKLPSDMSMAEYRAYRSKQMARAR